jgi:hypothetical protein
MADLQMVFFFSFRRWEAINTKGDANGAAHELAKIADGRDS